MLDTPAVACPNCRSALTLGTGNLRCDGCAVVYLIVDGIPILLPDPSRANHDELEHDHHGGGHEAGHKGSQAEFFDHQVAAEFEITRPHDTPRLYQFLMGEKFRRATAPIGQSLAGMTVLTVCGGSGMDAEFLARAGAQVTATDLSLEACRRSSERARRYDLDIRAIVADVERLPFQDGSFDLVLVHDGLHHLEQPEVGLAEMARVARRWVSVTEPAKALATSLLVRLGLALEHEEAGNRVERLAPAEVIEKLRSDGFTPLLAERYAMYYRHQPGSVFRVLSGRLSFPLVRSTWRFGNAVLGRAGNKLVVVAERQE